MYQIDKLRIIESDAVPKEGAKIEALSTCGCVLVEHFAAGKPDMRREEDPEKYDRLLAERKYFIELCNEHKNCK